MWLPGLNLSCYAYTVFLIEKHFCFFEGWHFNALGELGCVLNSEIQMVQDIMLLRDDLYQVSLFQFLASLLSSSSFTEAHFS